MEKSLYSERYKVMLDLIVESRESVRLTQAALGRAIHKSQPTVSKMESGERRIDVAELAEIATALGTTLPAFVKELTFRWKEAGFM